MRGASHVGGVGARIPTTGPRHVRRDPGTPLGTLSVRLGAIFGEPQRAWALHGLEGSSRSSGAAGAGGGSLRGARINERQIEMEGHASHTFSSIQPRLAIKPCAHRVATCTKPSARASKGSAPHGSAAARKRAAFARRAGGAAVAFQKIPPIAAPPRAGRYGSRARRATS